MATSGLVHIKLSVALPSVRKLSFFPILPIYIISPLLLYLHLHLRII